MTDEELQQVRKLVEAATPGPWLVSEVLGGVETTQLANNGDVYGGYLWAPDFDDETAETRRAYLARDGALIAASRTLVPQLLDEVARLRTTRDHSCACSINDGSAPLVKHDKNCPIRVNARKRIAPELALQRLGAALDSSDEADELRTEREALLAGRDVLSRDLCNLLARAHRDGGHYIDEHGLGKAVEVAHERIADAYMERDALRAEVKALEDAAHRSRCDLLDAQVEVNRLKSANASLVPGGMMTATEIECLRVERDAARAEAAASRPVVEAVRRWRLEAIRLAEESRQCAAELCDAFDLFNDRR